MLKNGKISGVVTDFTIHSIIVLLDRLRKLRELRKFLLSITAYKGLHIYTTSLVDEINAVEIAEKDGLDMDDAIQFTAAISINADAIISFDKNFDGLKIPRKEPAQIQQE